MVFSRCFINFKVHLINSFLLSLIKPTVIQKLKLQGGVVPAPLVAAVYRFFDLFHDSDKRKLASPLTSSSHYFKLGTILGARCLFIYYSAGTKCEVTVLLVCKLIRYLASLSLNTSSSTLALSLNKTCQPGFFRSCPIFLNLSSPT